MCAMTEVAGAYDGSAWITGIARTGCGIILKRAPPKSSVFEIEQACMTDSHNFEFPSMLLDFLKFYLKGDNATTILEMDTDADLFKSRHLITNQNFVPFHSMKALQSLKDELNNKSYLRLWTAKQTRSEKSCASSSLQSSLTTELREPDIPKT